MSRELTLTLLLAKRLHQLLGWLRDHGLSVRKACIRMCQAPSHLWQASLHMGHMWRQACMWDLLLCNAWKLSLACSSVHAHDTGALHAHCLDAGLGPSSTRALSISPTPVASRQRGPSSCQLQLLLLSQQQHDQQHQYYQHHRHQQQNRLHSCR